MKVLLVNGSPHAKGCTYTALREVGKELEAANISTQVFQLGTKAVHGCTACHKCDELDRCIFDDAANKLAAEIRQADGVVLGSPVYYGSVNGAFCAVLDRTFYSAGEHFANKPGAAIVSCRRAGSTAALDRLNKYLTISRMPLVTSQYWNMVHGHTPDDVRRDREGLQIMRTLGRNMAWLLQCIAAGEPPPAPEEPLLRTNFIR